VLYVGGEVIDWTMAIAVIARSFMIKLIFIIIIIKLFQESHHEGTAMWTIYKVVVGCITIRLIVIIILKLPRWVA